MIWTTEEYPPGALGVSCGESGRFSAFAACWSAAQAPKGSVEVWSMGYDTACNSNEIIAQAMVFCATCRHLHCPPDYRSSEDWRLGFTPHCLQCPCEDFAGLGWVWIMDDDHTFPSSTLLDLLARDVDVVVPLYMQRRPPFMPCIYKERNEKGYLIYTWDDLDGKPDLLPIVSAGKGGVLIRRHVLEKLASPKYFEWMGGVGEDHTFYRKCQEAGFQTVCDLNVRMGHLTPMILVPSHYDGKWVPQVDLHNGATVTLWPARMDAQHAAPA